MVKRGRDRKAEELAKSRTLNPHPEAVLDAAFTAIPSTSTRRTISYFTCTRSAASKNSEDANAASRTASGCGFSVLDFASSSAFRSRPRFTIRPPPVECPDYYAYSDTGSAADTPSPQQWDPVSTGEQGLPGRVRGDKETEQHRHNGGDTHGIVRLTAAGPPGACWARMRATSSPVRAARRCETATARQPPR